MNVSQIMNDRPLCIKMRTRVSTLIELLSGSQHNGFPVVQMTKDKSKLSALTSRLHM
jgi:hypothetical protein